MVSDTGSELQGHILVVDDNKLNRMLLLRLLSDLGHRVTQAVDGLEALTILRNPQTEPVDVVLLDILMPELDGYGLLEKIKSDDRLRSLPVIMTSALDELDSVVRCIEIGATDYLTKPLQPGLLKARLKSSLAEKRLRDLEREYLEQVSFVVAAAESVEAERYEPESLSTVAARTDALGRLARVFQKMAQEIHLREQRLKQQLARLQLDIEEMQKAMTEELQIYIPMDRRQALFQRHGLRAQSAGAVLFADISDFTHLTAMLSEELGRPRGAEEITRLINQIFAMLVEEVHRYRGSVISFGGDAITCWFDDRPETSGETSEPFSPGGLRAMVAGMNMQATIGQFEYFALHQDVRPGIKVVVVSGSNHRLVVGNPAIQNLEVLAGEPLERLGAIERHVNRGEVITDAATFEPYRDLFETRFREGDSESREELVVLSKAKDLLPPTPWPEIPVNALSPEDCRPWIHPHVYRQSLSLARQFMAELRPAAALFVQFQGIEFENDVDAGTLLDDYVRWVQNIIHHEDGALLQLSFGDKGSYLYAAFGAPFTHEDDAARAIRAGLNILDKPARFGAIHGEKLGVSYGHMRAGSYGGETHRTYGVIGSQTNLAARLMQAAPVGSLYCDDAAFESAKTSFRFQELPAIKVKGRQDPVAIFLPEALPDAITQPDQELLRSIDILPPSCQLSLKFASVIGHQFSVELLSHLLPPDTDRVTLEQDLAQLVESRLIQKADMPGEYKFSLQHLHDAAYQSMLYVQRRHLHRQLAEILERNPAETNPEFYPLLAAHWERAEETTKAIEYLEKAGQAAQAAGNLEKARQYIQKSLDLAQTNAVLSKNYLK